MTEAERWARRVVARWIRQERRLYADPQKWSGPPENAAARRAAIEADPSGSWSLDYARTYLHRAEQYGLDTEPGRQALGKAIVTATHGLETAVELWGAPPMPGHPSGECRPWPWSRAGAPDT